MQIKILEEVVKTNRRLAGANQRTRRKYCLIYLGNKVECKYETLYCCP